MSDSQDDPTSIGSILLAMGVITDSQLSQVVEEQTHASEDLVLGKMLVAAGLIDNDQLDIALSAQAGLRSKHIVKQAHAQADIAERSSASVIQMAKCVQRRSEDAKKSRTGDKFLAITDGMLKK